MRAWIRTAPVVLTLALAACQPTGTGRTAPVLGGTVSLGLPEGFCIDRSASREGRDQAVVLMGRCSNTSAPDPAILTYSVGTAGSASVLRGGGSELAGLFTSDRGRAMLARSGRAGDVRVLSARQSGEAFLLQLDDRRLGRYWRAITGARGRLVSISVTGAPGANLSQEAGRALLEQAVTALRRSNAG